jgi:diguanylate cyclase (GGDEF)-like protein
MPTEPSSAQDLASKRLFLIGLSNKESGHIQNLIGELSFGIDVVTLNTELKDALDEGLALEIKSCAILVPSVLLRKQADLFERLLKVWPYTGVLVGEDPLEIELGRFAHRVRCTIQRPLTAEKLLSLFELEAKEQKEPRALDVPQEGPRHFPGPLPHPEGSMPDSVEILRSVYESLDMEMAYERSLNALISVSQAKAGAMLERLNGQGSWQVRSLFAISNHELEPYLKVLSTLSPGGIQEAKLVQRLTQAGFSYVSMYPISLMDEGLAMALILSDSPLSPKAAWVYMDVLRALKNARLFSSIQEKSYADPLTGVFNRRFLEIELPRELFRAKRHQGRVSILFVEIDSIREIAKKYGEDAVQAILKEAAFRLSPNQGCIRNVDLLVKYGFFSFVIVLIESDYQNTLKVVGPRVLRVIREKQFLENEGVPISLTASVGVANFPVTSWDWRILLSAGEGALKEAQRAGGNTVVLSQESMV